uniref:ATP-binding cassette domain-containing protein n=1 Tax=Frankia sp. Cppng1_Ct_nod TaxID=2897162 RepID=UPI002024BE1D
MPSFVLGDFLLDEYTAIALEQEAEQVRVGRRQAMFRLTGDALAGTVIAAVYVALVLLLDAGLMPLVASGTAVPAIRTGRGEVVALVAENGSGKSTLSKVLAGLYDPDSGRVTWDDVDLAEVDPDNIREQIAIISQEYTQWPMSARLNIVVGRIRRLGKDGPDSVVPAARATEADTAISELPNGYDTLLARQYNAGHDLSGGQWQRIACARAVYREAPILIGDEPSTALDARAESQLFSSIRDLAEGRTVLLITHRLAGVRHADRVYVLERGRILDEGTHEQLMTRGGLYASCSISRPGSTRPECRLTRLGP